MARRCKHDEGDVGVTQHCKLAGLLDDALLALRINELSGGGVFDQPHGELLPSHGRRVTDEKEERDGEDLEKEDEEDNKMCRPM